MLIIIVILDEGKSLKTFSFYKFFPELKITITKGNVEKNKY